MYRSNYSTDFKANSAGENAPHLYSGKYYVVNDYKVYKCIYNGSSPANPNGTPSTVAPSGTGTASLALLMVISGSSSMVLLQTM